MQIECPSRIHVTLIDTTGHSSRVPGGVGFAMSNPFTRLDFHESQESSAHFLRVLDHRASEDVNALLLRLPKPLVRKPYRIECTSSPPAHHGFGSKTALLSAVAFGHRHWHDLETSDDELQLLTQRGGTSGVGYYTFRHGGLVWDAGRRNSDDDVGPSSKAKPTSPPLLMSQWAIPTYGVMLVVPNAPLLRVLSDWGR
jgi:beta-ribofuranosylaminobenzene 5'-phosphate synthase